MPGQPCSSPTYAQHIPPPPSLPPSLCPTLPLSPHASCLLSTSL